MDERKEQQEAKRIPCGILNFVDVREDNCYFIRPCLFCKTLTMWLFLIAASIVFLSCSGQNDIEKTLDKIECLIKEDPLKARAVLDSIPFTEITTRYNEARLCLLDTYCNYRLNCEGSDDSQIVKAESYFCKNGSSYNKMLSLFLHAQILKNAGQHQESMIKFKECQALGESVGDHFMLGQTYTQMFLLCIPNLDCDQLQYAQKALSEYEQFGDSTYILDGEINLAIARFNLNRYDECLPIFRALAEKSQQRADSFALAKSLLFLSECEVWTNREESALMHLERLNELDSITYKNKVNVIKAMAYASIGKKDSAIHCLNLAATDTDTDADRCNYLNYATHVYSKLEDFEQALSYSEQYHHLLDSIYSISINNSVMKVQKDFSDMQWKESERHSQLYYNIILLMTLLIVIVVISFFFYRKQQKTEMLMKEERMQHESEQLQMRNIQLQFLEEQLRMKEENRRTALQCMKQSEIVLRFKQSAIDYKCKITETDWTSLYNLFNELIPGYEQQIRSMYAINDSEWRICQLVKLGFQPGDIAVLTNKSKAAVSAIRTRLYFKLFNKEGSSKELDDFLLKI